MSHLDEHEQATVQRPQQQMCQVGEKGKQFHGGRSQRLGLSVGEHLFGQQIGHPDRLEQSFCKEFLDRGLPALVAGLLNRRHPLTYLRGERFVCPGGIDDDLELLRIHAFSYLPWFASVPMAAGKLQPHDRQHSHRGEIGGRSRNSRHTSKSPIKSYS